MSKSPPMPRDGGRYRREANGRLTLLEAPTGEPIAKAARRLESAAAESVTASAAAAPAAAAPITAAPRRRGAPESSKE